CLIVVWEWHRAERVKYAGVYTPGRATVGVKAILMPSMEEPIQTSAFRCSGSLIFTSYSTQAQNNLGCVQGLR
ncbi:hypothetical protein CEXT_152261, partial [Caerostris extrusa]